jgi:hypothetical protein
MSIDQNRTHPRPNIVLVHGAWADGSSWSSVAQDDQALHPEAQRMFANRMGATTAELPSGHLAMVSHPADVVKVTETASEAARTVDAVN